ncbi:MAG: LysR substrate-binding domain-containing protein [Salibacteraceae bacterium]
MNIQQIQYVLTVSELRSFSKAAEACFVTQSTLSAMVAKFEEEIGVQVFNRSTKPVSLTREGGEVVANLRLIMNQIKSFDETVKSLKGEVGLTLKIAVIPTILPYLLKVLIKVFRDDFSDTKFILSELRTEEIVEGLKSRDIDIGILAGPINESDLIETKLYDEPFVLLDLADDHASRTVNLQDINLQNFWVLEEGHCLSRQVRKLCEAIHDRDSDFGFEFRAGSMESLLHVVEASKGKTLLPLLTAEAYAKPLSASVYTFAEPVPARRVVMLTHRHFPATKRTDALAAAVHRMLHDRLGIQTEANIIDPR